MKLCDNQFRGILQPAVSATWYNFKITPISVHPDAQNWILSLNFINLRKFNKR